MIFYLGDIVENVIDNKIRLAKNKAKSWTYGYNSEIDTVIISKDGTLGEIYNIEGLNVGLPEKPENHLIYNFDKTSINQKWRRQELPNGLNEKTQFEKRFDEYIEQQFLLRKNGYWIYINGKPIYLTGTYWFGLQWYREEVEAPNFRVIQNELMIFWEACKADDRCYGMQYIKNRRIGASMLAIIELLESGTINQDKMLGIISKTGSDSSKIFRRLIKGFKRLPCFFKPLWDGTNYPKKELILNAPTKRRSKNEIEDEDGLGSTISWFNTSSNSMDGDPVFRSLLDESGKYPPDVPFDKYWYVVRTSHTKGKRITGKSMVVSTVNARTKGGAEYEKIYNQSDVRVRNLNNQTTSGLYSIFIKADYCLEGSFDVFGFTIIEDSEIPVLTDEGKYTTIGSTTYLNNTELSLKSSPEDYNEQKRQFPREVQDAFRDEATDCSFNLMKIIDHLDYNKKELQDTDDNGNTEVERGNFSWNSGVKDTTVKWNPDPINGRFWIAKNWHPSIETRNTKVQKSIHGIFAFAPTNGDLGTIGVDPYNTSKTADGRGSRGAMSLFTKMNTQGFPNNACIMEYIDRAPTVKLFFEDVIMAMIYFSVPILSELSNYEFLSLLKERGYRHFSMNNPFKDWSILSPAEKEFGGCPAQNVKIGEQQFTTIQSYIEDNLGYATDDSERPKGTIGYMPFSRTITQWKNFNPSKRTDSDAYISSSLSLIGNGKKVRTIVEQKPILMPFRMYDNSGSQSVPI